MGKSFNNPFAANPEMKFGLSPDASIVRPEVRMQENRGGVTRVPQRPVYQGAPRPQQAPGQRNDGSRDFRVPAPAGRAPAGAQRPAMAPAVSPRLNIPQHAAGNMAPQAAGNMAPQGTGHGMPAVNQAKLPHSNTGASVENPDRAGGKGQAKVRSVGNKAGSGTADGLKLDFSGDNLLRGFVMSEILGRPKCMRRGRW
jgi:hypothetical protein